MAGSKYNTIYQGIRTLGLSEPEYRALFKGVINKTSLKGAKPWELDKVIEALRKEGFKPLTRRPGDTIMDNDPQAKLVRHYWLKLAHYGELRNTSEIALLAYVKRITGVSRFEWLNQPQMTVVVETIKKWVERIEEKCIREAIAAGKLPDRPNGQFLTLTELLQQWWLWQEQVRVFLDGPHERRQ